MIINTLFQKRGIFMKIKLFILCIITSFLLFQTSAFAREKPKQKTTVRVNDITLTFDQPPIIKNGTTLVPLRAILEELGATVEWNEKTKTITCRKGTKQVVLKIGSKTMTVKNQTQTLTTPPEIVNNRVLIPLRAISQAFGATIKYNARLKLIDIYIDEPMTPEETIQAKVTSSTTTENITTLINTLTQKSANLDKSAASELITLINQIKAFDRTVKNYGNITDQKKLDEIQNQYKVYIQKLKNFANKYGISIE